MGGGGSIGIAGIVLFVEGGEENVDARRTPNCLNLSNPISDAMRKHFVLQTTDLSDVPFTSLSALHAAMMLIHYTFQTARLICIMRCSLQLLEARRKIP